MRFADIPHLPFQLVGPGSHSLCGVGSFHSQFHVAKLGSGYEKGSIFAAEIMNCRFSHRHHGNRLERPASMVGAGMYLHSIMIQFSLPQTVG